MRKLIFLIIFGLFAQLAAETSEQKALQALQNGQYKVAIKAYQNLSQSAKDSKKAEYLKQLSIAYYKDQEQGKAFEAFLEALAATPKPDKEAVLGEDEKALYVEGVKIYLDPKERDPQDLSLKIRDLYAGLWRLHPEYAHLGYLVALAYANLNDFPQFFDVFYRSYAQLPDHYLAHKTKAILHIKLYERKRTVEEKEQERKAILEELQQAKLREPKDTTLYRLQIAFSPEEKKPEVLSNNLNELLNSNMIVPRQDLPFYFDLLLAYGQVNLTEKLLTKAKGWYSYSRTIDAAEELLKEKKENGTTRTR